MDLLFDSEESLFKRLTPALKSKKKMMRKDKFYDITEDDIWNCLKKDLWNKRDDLSLCDMVDDILNTDNKDIYLRFKNVDFELPKLKDNQ